MDVWAAIDAIWAELPNADEVFSPADMCEFAYQMCEDSITVADVIREYNTRKAQD